jgi:CRISPR/Cas system-associated endonuclease/helicase Cas3
MKNEIAADKIISDLIEMGSGEISLMKFGKKWVFKMLNTKEHIKTLEGSKDSADDVVSRIFRMQCETLKEALVSIDDFPLSENDKEQLFDNVNPYIITSLYMQYDEERGKKENELANIK